MYIHPAFKLEQAQAIAMLKERGFGSLIVQTAKTPMAVHVPFLLKHESDGGITIELHVARINPIHTHITGES